MPTVTIYGDKYTCAVAQKGSDFIRLLDDNGDVVFFADGIKSFSNIVLSGGAWSTPRAVVAPTVSAVATLSGTTLSLDLPKSVKVETGLQINFNAPCDCGAVNDLSIGGNIYTVVDALGQVVTGKENTWVTGAQVSVALNAETKKAYLKNTQRCMEVGYYVGTGTAGPDNPTTLSFGFVPKVLVITEADDIDSNQAMVIINPGDNLVGGFVTDSNGMGYWMEITFSGSSVTWYSKNKSASQQANVSGKKYAYFAIG